MPHPPDVGTWWLVSSQGQQTRAGNRQWRAGKGGIGGLNTGGVESGRGALVGRWDREGSRQDRMKEEVGNPRDPGVLWS